MWGFCDFAARALRKSYSARNPRLARTPGFSPFGKDASETQASGRIGDINQVIAMGAMDLHSRESRFALQTLFAMGTRKFEIM
jgi:hypothetical protein